MARHSLLLLVWLLLLPSLAGAQGRTIVQGEACGGDLAGTFPACTIPAEIARDSELPTQASLSVDDVITLTGQPEGSVHLGTFTGSTITDNVTIKAAFQEVETAVEGATGSPGGSPGDVQYNNGGVFGGFGDFDDATNALTLPGDVTVSGTVTATDGFEATAVDNGHTSYPPATAGESLWDTGPNHDGLGTDDDCYEVRQSLTPGTSVVASYCPDGTGELNGSPLATSDNTVTLTNKTFDANGTGNVLSNVDEDNMLDGSDMVRDAIEFLIDGGGSAIGTGIHGDIEIPWNATIQRGTVLCDQTGDIEVDLWVDTFANYPPTVTESIVASAPLAVVSATASQDTTLTGWTTALTAGSIIRYNVNSASTVTRCTVSLVVEK